ncbi:MAG: hypothetical protein AB1646_24240 [Thermodesulfobacteriota bacterium]
MNHPEFLLVPIMMFADYFLTVLGAALHGKKYALYFKAPHYELNPAWQASIAKGQWFNLRHTLSVLLLSGWLLFLVEFGQLPEWFVQGALGCVCAVYGTVLGTHIGNIVIFLQLIGHPDEISGEVTLTHRLILVIALAQQVAVTLVLVLIAVFSPSAFVYGG